VTKYYCGGFGVSSGVVLVELLLFALATDAGQSGVVGSGFDPLKEPFAVETVGFAGELRGNQSGVSGVQEVAECVA
jgi:hypothetical protein